MNKLFHPTTGVSYQRILAQKEELREEDSQLAATILSNIGWHLQQGFPVESCAEILDLLVRNNRTDVIRACAAGVLSLGRDVTLDNL